MNNTKKRRADEGDNGGASGEEHGMDCSMVHQELKDIKSTMNEMMKHNCVHMARMMQMMKSMQGEIAQLTNECNEMKDKMEVIREDQVISTVQQNLLANSSDSKMNERFIEVMEKVDDMDDKISYHEVLLENQKWEYQARCPSEEYWDDVGDEEEEAGKDFLEQIKQNTEEMRYGTGDGDILINVEYPWDDGFLPHNDRYLPHWKEFADALEQHQYYCTKCIPNDIRLRLCSMELPDEVLDLLIEALESTHFTKFLLQNNNLGQKGIEFALNYLQNNSCMRWFTLVENPINNMEQIKQLCKIVEDHPLIEVLALDGSRGEGIDGHEMLQLIMNAGKSSKLDVINLSCNNISTGGDTFISDFLRDNQMLATLTLRGNQLDDNDAIAIATALKYNTKLRALDLTDNNISKSGWTALRKVEFDDTSLNSAADSNHTCAIKYPSGGDEIQGLDTSDMNGDINSGHCFAPMYVRQKKIYSVLSSRNRECSNVGYFDDVPVEFLPDILSSIERYSEYNIHDHAPPQGANDVKPISLMFEILQRWDKSLAVFESLSS